MFVHHRTRSLLIDADPAVIAAAVPSQLVSGPGFRVAAKHTAATTRKLRDMGFDAPSPIMAYYDWPKFKGRYEPFDHQKLMAEFMTLHRRCFNLSEMGTMKTSAVLWALDFMMNEGLVKSALIVAPLSILERVWLVACSDTVMHRNVQVVHGSVEKRLKQLATPADIYIINQDGLKIAKVKQAILRRRDINHVIVDEGADFRHARNDRYRCLEEVVAKPEMGLWWLTGTPCPKSPENAWAQTRLVSPSKVPRFFGTWRAKVCVEFGEHNWKPRKGHEEIVFSVMQPAIRFAKKDVLDLPPMVPMDMEAKLSDEQLVAFKQMAGAMSAAHRSGEVITAVNAADRLNKLRQIMCGSVKSGPDTYVTYDYKPRLKALLEAIERASAKVIVVVPFKGILRELTAEVGKHYSVAMVNGDVPIKQRNQIFSDFTMNKDPEVLLCHPKVMSHGLNLTEADVLIFYAPMYGNDGYRQVIERINRPPQTKKMTLVKIGCHLLEWAIYKALDSDEDQQQLILNLYNSVVGGGSA